MRSAYSSRSSSTGNCSNLSRSGASFISSSNCGLGCFLVAAKEKIEKFHRGLGPTARLNQVAEERLRMLFVSGHFRVTQVSSQDRRLVVISVKTEDCLSLILCDFSICKGRDDPPAKVVPSADLEPPLCRPKREFRKLSIERNGELVVLEGILNGMCVCVPFAGSICLNERREQDAVTEVRDLEAKA